MLEFLKLQQQHSEILCDTMFSAYIVKNFLKKFLISAQHSITITLCNH